MDIISRNVIVMVTFRLIVSVLIASIGSGFQHGYNMAVLNTPADVIKGWILETHEERYGEKLGQIELIWGVTTSVYCVGGIIGGVSVSQMIKRFGSKKGLIYNNLIVIIGAGMEFAADYARSYELLILGRFVVGINSGLNSGICSIYVCDLAPRSHRGTMGSLYQFWLTTSMMIASIAGTNRLLGTPTLWHFMLALPIIAALLQALLLATFTPESPRDLLIMRGNETKAIKALKWLRGPVDIQEEISQMKSEQDEINSLPKLCLKDFRKQPFRKPTIIVIVMMVAQQFSGIATIGYFSSHIYVDEAGLSKPTMELANIGYNCLNAAMMVLSILLLMEKAGRRTLLLISYSCMSIAQAMLLAALLLFHVAKWIPYMSIVSIYLHGLSFSTGAGPIPWFLVSEMFPQNAKPLAQTFVVLACWGCNFSIALSFPPLAKVIGDYVFFFHAVCNASTVIFIVLYVPETKNKTLDEVRDGLTKK